MNTLAICKVAYKDCQSPYPFILFVLRLGPRYDESTRAKKRRLISRPLYSTLPTYDCVNDVLNFRPKRGSSK